MEGGLRALLPCPFCGSNINEQNDKGFRSDIGTAYWVRCQSCGAEGPTAIHGTDQATELWNTRTGDPLLEKMAEALGNMMEIYYGRAVQDFPGQMAKQANEALQEYRERMKPAG